MSIVDLRRLVRLIPRPFRGVSARKSESAGRPDLESDLDPQFVKHWRGHCWCCAISPDTFPKTDDTTDPKRSWLILSEDGCDLGPAHEAHDMIAQQGLGRYSHWQHVLHFSTSDNSDPMTNGRCYTIRADRGQYFGDLAEYALGIVDRWCTNVSGGIEALRGRRVFEVGAGRSMGTVVAMAALGAEVLAVDRFCGEWQDDWHESYFPALRDAMAVRGWTFDRTLFDQILADRSFDRDNLHVETRSLEDLSRYDSFADLSFSHSTFEHFYDFPSAAASLGRICKPGSLGVHDVDFRDHKNFGTPLEFLLISDADYAQDEVNDQYGRGNRVRPFEMQAALAAADFKDIVFKPYDSATDDYLDGLFARLADKDGSRRYERQQLAPLAGTFIFRRAADS